MLLITSIIVSLLAILFIKLSFAVIKLRRANKIGLGTGGNESLERAIRAQGNFIEYVPIGVLMLATLELNGVSLIGGRFFHSIGINTPPPDFSKRVLGMQLTLFTLIGLIILNLGWTIYRLAL